MSTVAKNSRTLKAGLAASVAAAFAASMCCLGPALFIAAGGLITASVGSVFETLAAWRPVFIAASLGFLGLGYWYVYRGRKSAEACETGTCTPKNPVNKFMMGTVAVIVAVLVTSPYWLAGLA
ncbi:MAG: hypothetical protein HYY13_02390 [Nitrospirae bacterium]|nr:hypothetical protein [Nitrospirota bacterium]